MAYISGSVSNISGLKAAILAGCSANGWTQSGDILYRGDCHVKISVDTVNDWLDLLVGNGMSGTNITDAAPASVFCCRPMSAVTFSYPLSYFLHIMDDEVYLVCNFQTSYYMTLAFGQSPIAGAPGTGVWIAGNAYISDAAGGSFNWSDHCMAGNHYSSANNDARTGLFIVHSGGGGAASAGCYVHTGLLGWSGTGSDMTKTWRGIRQLHGIDNPSTNAYGQSILVGIQPWIYVGSNKTSLVADLKHARYVRMDNIEPLEVISEGSDHWKVYPVYRKDASARNGGLLHSGTYGYAIRYDGPT